MIIRSLFTHGDFGKDLRIDQVREFMIGILWIYGALGVSNAALIGLSLTRRSRAVTGRWFHLWVEQHRRQPLSVAISGLTNKACSEEDCA